MKLYSVYVPAEAVSGGQWYMVSAEDEDDALIRFNNGEGEFDYEELEVTSIGDPEITEVDDEV